ncbi:MAG: hypothetical protein WA461_03210 [Nitrososphaeraceae archaeon]
MESRAAPLALNLNLSVLTSMSHYPKIRQHARIPSGIPPSFAEYSKSAQYTSSANSCGNTEADDDTTNPLASAYQSSDYETLVDNTATYCANTDSQIQGEENSVGLSSSQR